MAQANVVDRVVRRPEAVSLTLSLEEAVALRTTLRHIGGTPSQSVRGFMDSVGLALGHAGVPCVSDGEELTERNRESIVFADGSDAPIRAVAKEWEVSAA